MNGIKCTLCEGNIEFFKTWRNKDYYRCKNCKSLLLDPENYLSVEEERKRYEKHNNDVHDKGYQRFVSPIVESVLIDYNEDHIGLDFGAGTGPVISKLLRDKNYNIKIYDPFFANNPKLLDKKYDYVVCCEVIEHFHNPQKEFRLLRTLLNLGGTLYCMTEIYDEKINFDNWHYKNDETHVFFYHKRALDIIKEVFGFSNLEISNNLIKFTRKV